MQPSIPATFWYPIVESQDEFELLPESWKEGTDLKTFNMWRAKQFEELEAWSEQYNIKFTIVRTTPSYMRYMLNGKPDTVKGIMQVCNLLTQVPGFDSNTVLRKPDDE